MRSVRTGGGVTNRSSHTDLKGSRRSSASSSGQVVKWQLDNSSSNERDHSNGVSVRGRVPTPRPSIHRTLGYLPSLATSTSASQVTPQPWRLKSIEEGEGEGASAEARRLRRHRLDAHRGTGESPEEEAAVLENERKRLESLGYTGSNTQDLTFVKKDWVDARKAENAIAQFKHADSLNKDFATYYGTAYVPPVWNKASRDPGDKNARVIGGYARKIDDTSVSLNAPTFMQIPEVMSHVTQTGLGAKFKAVKGGLYDSEMGRANSTFDSAPIRDDSAESEDAPLWFHSKTLSDFQEKLDRGDVPEGYGTGYKSFCVGSCVMFEPDRPVPKTPVDYVSSYAPSAGGSGGGRGGQANQEEQVAGVGVGGGGALLSSSASAPPTTRAAIADGGEGGGNDDGDGDAGQSGASLPLSSSPSLSLASAQRRASGGRSHRTRSTTGRRESRGDDESKGTAREGGGSGLGATPGLMSPPPSSRVTERSGGVSARAGGSTLPPEHLHAKPPATSRSERLISARKW